ncbi:Protein kinase domain-containing protein [Aspergillus clavatus NRRL 1]|uniref:EKC/KEOPS complex subunit BUD32 n=1 Tax=Aspergillus clavatus (strain ATCC 1007 / CBS 513.65 / DSM 816 / NCTC 3887 / NRRL 1 / QM 1276 / 107) TaxID=344612 RepID=A1CBS7_ASPCL|nr:Protein kinase domain-containing protein [Aspergillus clavatus NRRL 1]EAW13195.1 Protein kinase domain-containing protein [Aspergillus clavatus NRRL 1]
MASRQFASDGFRPEDRALADYRPWRNWKDRFETVIPFLLRPDSDVSQENPLLHQLVQSRYEESLETRAGEPISRCPHEYDRLSSATMLNRSRKRRADTREFQERVVRFERPAKRPATAAERKLPVNQLRFEAICSSLKEDIRIIGRIGSGSYGTVYLGRGPAPGAPYDPANEMTYAIKVEDHRTISESFWGQSKPEMVCIMDNGRVRLIPREAMVMLLLTNNPRFPTLASVWTEARDTAIVMSACVDHRMTERLLTRQKKKEEKEKEKKKKAPWQIKAPSFCGDFLMYHKQTLIDEVEACKVSSQLLEAIAYLRDMNLSYDDLSHLNYLVDENLNVQLIDFGLMSFGLKESDFDTNLYTYLIYQEYQIMPELVIEVMKPNYLFDLQRNWGQMTVYLPNDVRQSHLWKYAAMVYGLLHGFAPWEDPEWDQGVGLIEDFIEDRLTPENYYQGARWEAAAKRRKQMVNEELPIDESLSQDCVDMLRATLQKDPTQRPRLSELESFPWFGQWASHTDRSFRRPRSRVYEALLPSNIRDSN